MGTWPPHRRLVCGAWVERLYDTFVGCDLRHREIRLTVKTGTLEVACCEYVTFPRQRSPPQALDLVGSIQAVVGLPSRAPRCGISRRSRRVARSAPDGAVRSPALGAFQSLCVPSSSASVDRSGRRYFVFVVSRMPVRANPLSAPNVNRRAPDRVLARCSGANKCRGRMIEWTF